MTTHDPNLSPPDAGGNPPLPPGVDGGMPPPQQPPYARDGRSVSFYLAIFLGLLLFVSGGLNLVLLFVSALGSATGGFAVSEEADAAYEIVAVAGDADAVERVLQVPIVGAIAEGASPLIGAAGGTVSRVRRALAVAARQESIKGVLLDINSPGGGVTDSDEIHRLITEFRNEHEKPVVALFGDMAASGGYYIAAACDRILARPTSITGSIGVIMNSYNFAEAAKKLGIESVAIKSDRTPFKDLMSQFRPMRPEEQVILESIVDEMYDRFVDVVDAGRPELSRDEVQRYADGRIYSAAQALASGLVDQIGTVDDAYAVLYELAGIEGARVVEHRRRPTLGEALFGVRAPSLDDNLAGLLQGSTGPRFLYYWPGGR